MRVFRISIPCRVGSTSTARRHRCLDRLATGRQRTLPGTPDDLYFATDDLDAVFDRAEAAAATGVSPIETRP